MVVNLETERLYIRELRADDEEGMFELDSDPEVHRYLGQKHVSTREEVRAVLDFILRQYKENGIGRWAVIEKATGDFIGWTGFKLMLEPANGHINHYDFGYRLCRKAWGKGYGTESGRAALKYGVEQLGLSPVYAMTDVNNTASRNVLEKLGFRFVEVFAFTTPQGWRSDEDLTATWYELPEDWNKTEVSSER